MFRRSQWRALFLGSCVLAVACAPRVPERALGLWRSQADAVALAQSGAAGDAGSSSTDKNTKPNFSQMADGLARDLGRVFAVRSVLITPEEIRYLAMGMERREKYRVQSAQEDRLVLETEKSGARIEIQFTDQNQITYKDSREGGVTHTMRRVEP